MKTSAKQFPKYQLLFDLKVLEQTTKSLDKHNLSPNLLKWKCSISPKFSPKFSPLMPHPTPPHGHCLVPIAFRRSQVTMHSFTTDSWSQRRWNQFLIILVWQYCQSQLETLTRAGFKLPSSDYRTLHYSPPHCSVLHRISLCCIAEHGKAP